MQNWDVRKSNYEPSKLVVSFEHQYLDLSLKITNHDIKEWIAA